MIKTDFSSSFKVLDVTLRDGGYRNNFHFDQSVARRIVKDLSESNVDYIEVGYRNGLAKDSGELGSTGQSTNAYIQDLRSYCPNAQIGVMLHPHKVKAQDLYELKELGVSLIRVCLTAPSMEENITTVNACKDLGFTTTANIIKVSTRSLAQVQEMVEVLDQSQVDVIYIADSFGNLVPQKVAEYLQAMRSVTPKTLGFHAHNNLTLALANSISAIENGAGFIDASICGMGFGTGNLATEVLAGYLERIGKGQRLNTSKIFQLARFISYIVPNSHLPLNSLDIFWGLNNLSSHFRKPIEEIARREHISVFALSKLVAEQKDIRPVESEIMELVHHNFHQTPSVQI